MKKYLIIFLTFFLFNSPVSATHFMGGEITWECITGGPDVGKYVFTLRLYKDCAGAATFVLTQQVVDVHNYPTLGTVTPIVLNWIDTNDISPSGSSAAANCFDCTNNIGIGAVLEYIYVSDPITLAGSPPAEGWHFVWGSCCRSSNITNGMADDSWTLRAVMYPYTDAGGTVFPTDSCYDNSPEFRELAKTMICTGSPFAYSDNASDQELDEISYSWGEPLGDNVNYDPSNPSSTAIPFLSPYSVASPIPGNPTLDSQTGEIAFSPNTTGTFVTCVKVEARKCGQIVAEIYRESQVVLLACPTSTNGMVNNSPTITAPLGSQIWNNTINSAGLPSYSTTVTAGELISFSLDGEDLDMYNNITPQDLTMTISGEPLSSDYINPLLCAHPPCATFTELGGSPPPIVFASLVSGVFEWQTSSDHITTNGCNNPFSVFVFSIKVHDDFCPVNGVSIATIKITIEPLTTGIEDQLSHFAIYPNPINDVLYIEVDYDAVQIFDILGNSLLQSDKQSEINVSHLSIGAYIVELKIANKSVRKKLQIVR